MGITHIKSKKKKKYFWNVAYVIKSGNFRFCSFRLKAPTEDAERKWLGKKTVIIRNFTVGRSR